MLTLFDYDHRKRRRDFLKIGAGGAAAWMMSSLMGNSVNANDLASLVKDRAVVFLFLHGGPSQIETFDPKMTAPQGIRSATGEVATRIPGVTFGGTFPKLAGLADKFSIIRSFQAGDGNHDIKPIVGKSTRGANLGSLFTRICGANHPITGMPRNVALFPRAVDPSTQPGTTSFGNFSSTGTLGSAYAPFQPGAGGDAQTALQLALPRERFDDRQSLLTNLDRLRRTVDANGAVQGLDRFQQQAFTAILGGVSRAFEWEREDRKTIERYDTAPLVHPESISRKWNNYNNYVDNVKSLGKLLLLSRRLCEAGSGFVMVTTNFVWDMHSDVNNAGVEEGMQYMGWPLDHAVSAFIEDLEQRGLSDKIMLVVTGEMGRTPRINDRGGRDHWGDLTPLLVYGGGTKGGQVIGHSSRDAGSPASEPIRNEHLVSTVLHSLMDVGRLRTLTGVPDDIIRATSADPIPGLM